MSTTPTLPGPRLRRVTDHIQGNLDQDLTLARLGAVASMSPFHFARLFKSTTGLPPHRFVLRARVVPSHSHDDGRVLAEVFRVLELAVAFAHVVCRPHGLPCTRRAIPGACPAP